MPTAAPIRISGLDEIEECYAKRWYRRRFNVALVGLVGLVWWIPAWVFLPSHRDVFVFAFTSILGAVLLPAGLWRAYLVDDDLRNGHARQETFEFVREAKISGQTLYRWRSSNRRVDCQKAMVDWTPSRGDRALIRYLSRSGLPLSVARLGGNRARGD